jgi:hypothetical protein
VTRVQAVMVAPVQAVVGGAAKNAMGNFGAAGNGGAGLVVVTRWAKNADSQTQLVTS